MRNAGDVRNARARGPATQWALALGFVILTTADLASAAKPATHTERRAPAEDDADVTDMLDESPYAATATPPRRARAVPRSATHRARASATAPPDAAATSEPSRGGRYFLRAGFETTLRRFEDSERGPGASRVYQASPVPGFSTGVELYPLFRGALGLDGAFARSLDFHSTTSDRAQVNTSWTRVEAALRGRAVFGAARAAWVSLLAGYGYSSFAFGRTPPAREIPTAGYHELRFGFDARAPIRRFALLGGAEYDHLVSLAPLGTTSAKAPGNGVTARLGGGFSITPWLFARIEARLAWSTYALVRDVAARATDEYLTGSAGVEAAF